MKKIGIILCFLIMITGCGASAYKKVSYNEAKALIKEGAIVIDVRTNLEYDQGHIKESVNVEHFKIDTITYNKNKKIIVYCRSGSRSKEAADILVKMGYKHIYDLGSKDKWKEELVK